MRRRGPRRVSHALDQLFEELHPPTRLASAQGVWESIAGPAVAAEALPVAERDGVVTVACRSAAWAQELQLLSQKLLRQLNASLVASRPDAEPIAALRFVVDARPFDA